MTSKVAISKCVDYEYEKVYKAVKDSIDCLGGIKQYVSEGDIVALKPNLIMQKKPENCATTHPTVIKAVGELVREAGGKPVIVESPGGPYTVNWLKSIYRATEMKDTEVELNYNTASIEVDNPDGEILKKLEILEPLVKADVIINISKLKSHGQMIYTGAVKNMFGSVPGILKAEYHFRMSDYVAFSNALVDIFRASKVTLNIMDGIIGMEGEGPTAGDPRDVGLILCSEDAFALDTAAIWSVGTDPLDIPIIQRGVERGYCTGKIEDIELLGDILEKSIIDDFNFPALKGLKNFQFSNNKIIKIFTDSIRPRPVIDRKLCVSCGICARNCPAKVIDMSKGRPEIDLSGCIRCYCCQELCPKEAITIKRRTLFKSVSGKTKKGEK